MNRNDLTTAVAGESPRINRSDTYNHARSRGRQEFCSLPYSTQHDLVNLDLGTPSRDLVSGTWQQHLIGLNVKSGDAKKTSGCFCFTSLRPVTHSRPIAAHMDSLLRLEMTAGVCESASNQWILSASVKIDIKLSVTSEFVFSCAVPS